jgi:hypothetical protein
VLGFTRSMTREQRRNWWAGPLSRQQPTNVPVTAFPQQLGVPASTFYDLNGRLSQKRQIWRSCTTARSDRGLLPGLVRYNGSVKGPCGGDSPIAFLPEVWN